MYTRRVPKATIYLDRELAGHLQAVRLPVSAICQDALWKALAEYGAVGELDWPYAKAPKPREKETR
jgi:post-segregation antitoxin (ccd killing protein)